MNQMSLCFLLAQHLVLCSIILPMLDMLLHLSQIEFAQLDSCITFILALWIFSFSWTNPIEHVSPFPLGCPPLHLCVCIVMHQFKQKNNNDDFFFIIFKQVATCFPLENWDVLSITSYFASSTTMLLIWISFFGHILFTFI
jgi:hypothetical protein